MGKKDSSKTRVVPVFDRLFEYDPTGVAWLPRLLRLPVGGNPPPVLEESSFQIEACGWGHNERKLSPPVSLLSWLIRHPRKPLSGALSANTEKAMVREEWLAGSEKRIREGLALLRSNPENLDWHIFEGETQPDVYIETNDIIVVIEGKRTEHGPTTKTKWMDGRHQMLRHIDCAWEIRSRKKVAGFFIVEGTGEAKNELDEKWLQIARETTEPAAISTSLPHRGPEEQAQIAACFTGVTTWQRVCCEFEDMGLAANALPDECEG
jgi:hypothetical protein